MKIRLAAVAPEHLSRVHELISKLRDAANAGDMDGMDAATEKLLTLADKRRSFDLTEEEWRRWLAEVRRKDPSFQSDYLLSGELCTQYFPDATSKTMVLQLPVDEREGVDVR